MTDKLPHGYLDVITFEDGVASERHEQQTAKLPSPLAMVRSPPSPNTETEAESPLSLALAPPYGPAPCWPNLRHPSLAHLLAFMDALGDVPTPLLDTLDPSSTGRHDPVLQVLSDPQMFHVFHRHFVIGRSFSDRFREAIMMVLKSSDGVILDAYSTALALWDSDNNKMRGLGELDLGEGSQRLKQLQAPAIAHHKDAAAVVMLGQILLVYHIVVLCTSAHAIVRRSLLLVKDWYPSLLTEPSLYPITITPIFVDTIESLVKREIPVIQAPPDEAGNCSIVDRSAGLCVGLIHLQYEVCKIGHQARRAAIITDDGLADSTTSQHGKVLYAQLNEIKRRVSNWEPKPPREFFTQYTQPEVSAMMMQARVYRMATLLIIHRLRYPLGVEDGPVAWLAMSIVAELECFVQWVPDGMEGISIGLPLLVALLEVDDVSEKVIQYVSPAGPDRIYVDQLRAFIHLAKSERDNGFCGLWFDIAEDKLSMPVLA